MIYLICFHEVSNNQEKSVAFINYKIVKSLYNNKLHVSFYTSDIGGKSAGYENRILIRKSAV